MKKTEIVISLIMLCITLCGCVSNGFVGIDDSKTNLFSGSSEVYSKNGDDNSTQTDFLKSEGGGIHNRQDCYTFSGESFQLEYEYHAEGTQTLGFMIFCNGQITPYHTEYDSNDQYMHIVNVNTSVTTDSTNEDYWTIIMFSFTPIGTQGETVDLQIVDIIDPAYDFNCFDPNESYEPLIYGMKGYTLYSYPSKINMLADGLSPSKKISTNNYKQEAIDAETLESWIYIDENGVTRSKADDLQMDSIINNNSPSLYYKLKKGEKLTIETTVVGGNADHLIASIYLNYELYPVYQGQEYAEFPVDRQNYTKLQTVIETDALAVGRYNCNLITVTTDHLSILPVRNFIIDVVE